MRKLNDSKVNVNTDIDMSCLGVQEIDFYPLFNTSYYFDNVDMLIFESNNIII